MPAAQAAAGVSAPAADIQADRGLSTAALGVTLPWGATAGPCSGVCSTTGAGATGTGDASHGQRRPEIGSVEAGRGARGTTFARRRR